MILNWFGISIELNLGRNRVADQRILSSSNAVAEAGISVVFADTSFYGRRKRLAEGDRMLPSISQDKSRTNSKLVRGQSRRRRRDNSVPQARAAPGPLIDDDIISLSQASSSGVILPEGSSQT